MGEHLKAQPISGLLNEKSSVNLQEYKLQITKWEAKEWQTIGWREWNEGSYKKVRDWLLEQSNQISSDAGLPDIVLTWFKCVTWKTSVNSKSN